jgi:transcriptional regulator GlxA family with amidase domain
VRIAIALFNGVEELDFAGPWEVLAYWAQNVAAGAADGSVAGAVEVVTVAETPEAITAAKGLRVLPHRTWSEVGAVDVLVFPGGQGTRPLMRDPATLDRLRELAHGGTLLTSVCTGSLVFAAAGLLAGRPATTHWEALGELAMADPSITIRAEERWVDDGDVVTAAGVSAGIDMALHLIARLHSPEAARQVKRGIQYDPQPPV